MSTKSSKKTAAASPSSGAQTSPPATSTPLPRRPSSPLSPTRFSRLQEKQELRNLNDRLACYIEKVRNLETENSRLVREVQTMRETTTRESSNIKTIYDRELSDARRLIDETARERAKLEIDTKRLWDDNEDLQTQLNKKQKDLQDTERSLLLYESRFNDLQLQLNQSQVERKKLAESNRELQKECEKLKAQYDDNRKHLEQETLQRIDLENNIQSLKEELSFKDQVHQQEFAETSTKRQIEISEIDGRLAEQYETKLQRLLQELRDQYDAQTRTNREEIELLYENKIKNLALHAQRNSGAATLALQDFGQAKCRIDELNKKINELECALNAVNGQKRTLEETRENERGRYLESVALLESELSRNRDEISQLLQEYQDLMDIKVALDLEIAAYRKLLESEEARLNITPGQSASCSGSSGRNTPSRHTPLRSGKRKRTFVEESEELSSTDYSMTGTARGDVEITEVDPRGHFVKLTNKGNKEIVLSGWQIMRKAGTLETVFKFHRTAKVEAGATVTVWSADIGASHEPPLNIVMKGQKWFIADTMTTTLVNNDGEEMATSERRKEQASSTRSRHRENLGSYPLEDLHHQQGDPPGQELCRIM